MCHHHTIIEFVQWTTSFYLEIKFLFAKSYVAKLKQRLPAVRQFALNLTSDPHLVWKRKRSLMSNTSPPPRWRDDGWETWTSIGNRMLTSSTTPPDSVWTIEKWKFWEQKKFAYPSGRWFCLPVVPSAMTWKLGHIFRINWPVRVRALVYY